jgi:hypothetical protein
VALPFFPPEQKQNIWGKIMENKKSTYRFAIISLIDKYYCYFYSYYARKKLENNATYISCPADFSACLTTL